MKRNTLLTFGILPASLLAACVTCHAGVYAQGGYAGGTTYYDLCSTTLPFPPYHFEIEESCWREDANGYCTSFDPRPQPGDISRRNLQLKYGSQTTNWRLESGPPRRHEYDNEQPLTKDKGDLSVTLTWCVAALGGRANTNAMPLLSASWLQHSGTNEDIIFLEDDQFAAIQNVLEQAYGKPDPAVISSNPAGGKGQSINYTPAQIGVLLNLTVAWDSTTIVTIIRKQ